MVPAWTAGCCEGDRSAERPINAPPLTLHNHAGADDFLPVLIYVLIHANPPQLASNLMYIERFRMHSRMMSESAYFFTQLVGTSLDPKPVSCFSPGREIFIWNSLILRLSSNHDR